MTDHEIMWFTLHQLPCLSQLSAELPAAAVMMSSATVRSFEQLTNPSGAKPGAPEWGKTEHEVGRKKERDSNRTKLVTNPTGRVIEDVGSPHGRGDHNCHQVSLRGPEV